MGAGMEVRGVGRGMEEVREAGPGMVVGVVEVRGAGFFLRGIPEGFLGGGFFTP